MHCFINKCFITFVFSFPLNSPQICPFLRILLQTFFYKITEGVWKKIRRQRGWRLVHDVVCRRDKTYYLYELIKINQSISRKNSSMKCIFRLESELGTQFFLTFGSDRLILFMNAPTYRTYSKTLSHSIFSLGLAPGTYYIYKFIA